LTSILIKTVSKSGKFPEPYHHVALVNSVDRNKPNENLPQNKNSHTSQHPPLQSPYTRVYGKREISDIRKLKLTLHRYKMTGQGGAARDLTADPDFEMRDAISPPQGTKRSGASRSTSAEKKNRTASKETSLAEKKTKNVAKEASAPIKSFWLRFETMEKLAIEEGAPIAYTPTTIQGLIKSGFSEK
jgi:hypothetical protein